MTTSNVNTTAPATGKVIHDEEPMSPPFMYAGNQSVHTVLSFWDRKLLYASSEASRWGCDKDPMNWAAMIDNKDPTKPRLISMFPPPRPPKGAPFRSFCEKEGRFGPHNTVMEQHNPEDILAAEAPNERVVRGECPFVLLDRDPAVRLADGH